MLLEGGMVFRMNDNDYCTEEESNRRLEFCKLCEAFVINENNITQCLETGCLINLMISSFSKQCPKGNWS